MTVQRLKCEPAANYCNSRPLPAEILVEGTTATVVRKRLTSDDLIEGEL